MERPSYAFLRVIKWLTKEREAYQQKKFDYDIEAEKLDDYDYWIQQFDSYIQRIPIFGVNAPQGRQAALKLAATTVAFCEHIADKYELPMPGVPSGTIEEWHEQ